MAYPASQSAQAGEPILSFDWRIARWFTDPLFRFLLVSALCHLLVFMLLQVVSTEKVTAPDREREMQFLSTEIPEHKALLDAVEAETPLAALSHQLLSVESLLSRPYASALMDSKPAPREATLWKNPASVALPRGSFFLERVSAQQQIQHKPFAGRLVLEGDLGDRLVDSPETPSGPADKALERSEFLLGVSTTGEVKFVILQKSSGDTHSDTIAEHFLRQVAFAPRGKEIEWGLARLEWKALP